jgi:hypothetical protein
LPWGHTNLIGSVYLNPGPVPAAETAAASKGPTLASTGGNNDVELEFWRSIKDSKKPEELNAYLSSYPNGQFRSLALSRLASLGNPSNNAAGNSDAQTRNLTSVDPATFNDEANQVTEDQIGLDRGQRRDVQRRLNGLGFDSRP